MKLTDTLGEFRHGIAANGFVVSDILANGLAAKDCTYFEETYFIALLDIELCDMGYLEDLFVHCRSGD